MDARELFQNDTFLLSRSTEFNPAFQAPGNLEYLPFQNAGIHFGMRLLTKDRNVLIADPPGLGKTIQSIGILNQLNKSSDVPWRTLIIVPASLMHNWKKELKTWLMDWGEGQPSIEFLDSKSIKKGLKADVMVASYGIMSQKDIVAKIRRHFNYEILILDEVHYLKNPKSQRTKNVLAKDGLASYASGTIAMTGTPIVNRPIELFPVIASLSPSAIGSLTYFQYGLKYCAGKKENKRTWGGRSALVWNFDGASNLKELGRKLRSNFMIRRAKKDVLKDLPDKTRSIIYLERNPSVNRIVRSASAFNNKDVLSKKSFSDFDLDDEEDNLSSYRRELGIEKAPIAAEYLKTQLNSGRDKIIVFAHHTHVIEILRQSLQEFGVVEITGKTNRDQRALAVDKFQGDKGTRVFLGSIKAAGVGHTLTASSYVAFVEPSWVPGENEQAIDRAHRIGQESHVLAEFLCFENDLDDLVLRTETLKQMNINKVVN